MGALGAIETIVGVIRIRIGFGIALKIGKAKAEPDGGSPIKIVLGAIAAAVDNIPSRDGHFVLIGESAIGVVGFADGRLDLGRVGQNLWKEHGALVESWGEDILLRRGVAAAVGPTTVIGVDEDLDIVALPGVVGATRGLGAEEVVVDAGGDIEQVGLLVPAGPDFDLLIGFGHGTVNGAADAGEVDLG